MSCERCQGRGWIRDLDWSKDPCPGGGDRPPSPPVVRVDCPVCEGEEIEETDISDDENKRRIVAAAINLDKVILTLPPPARHHTLIHAAHDLFGIVRISSDKQAFIDSDGAFVDRIEAARIAIEAGQIKELKWPPNLFSEDLW